MNGVNIFNLIRQRQDRIYQDYVPEATADNIAELKNILLNDNYSTQLNQFVNTLMNRIVLTIIERKSFSNPLAFLKKGSTPLGTDIQDIYENPAQSKPYEYSDAAMAQLLKITDPDTHVAYYRRNRQDKYKRTISREGLAGAFASWDAFERYVSEIANSLYSGNYIDEFNYTKDLVDGAYNNAKALIEVVSDVEDESTAKAFLKKVRYLFSAMSFPSEEYAPYNKMVDEDATKITTWTDKDRVCLIIRADIRSEIDVDALAAAFNLDKTDFMGRVIEVDKFADDKILGIICDEAFFQIYDQVFRFDSFYNPETMAWSYFLHAWGTYAISPFANAVILATADSTPVKSIDLGSDISDLEEEDTDTLTPTLDPVNATSDIVYSSSDEEVFTVTESSGTLTLTGVAKGTAKLIAKADNGVTDEISVTVIEKSGN